jgi:hypothetical protein
VSRWIEAGIVDERRLYVKDSLAYTLAFSICIAAIGIGPLINRTSAQTGTTSQSAIDKEAQLLRQDIRSQKKQLVAANLNLTDTEVTTFWPVYDRYAADLMKVNDEKYALIKEYADSWGTIADDQALSLTNRVLANEKNVAELRIRYVPLFVKVIPGKKAATFFQLERRIQALIDLQVAAQLPLVQGQ